MSREVVSRVVSLSDFLMAGIVLEVTRDNGVLKVTSGTEDGKHLDMKKLPSMLYQLGIVTDHNIEVQEKTQHRKMDGTLTENYRISGKERTDKKWLQSGYASEEAKISSSRMKDMVSVTSRLANGGG